MSHRESARKVIEVDAGGKRGVKTITQAMAAAASGDLVRIHPGAYTNETFPINQPSGVNVECPGGPEITYVDAGTTTLGVTIWQHASNQKVKGLRVYGSYAQYGFYVPTNVNGVEWEDCISDTIGNASTGGYGWWINGGTGTNPLRWKNCRLSGTHYSGGIFGNGSAHYAGDIEIDGLSLWKPSTFSVTSSDFLRLFTTGLGVARNVLLKGHAGVSGRGMTISGTGGVWKVHACDIYSTTSDAFNTNAAATYFHNCYSHSPGSGYAITGGSTAVIRVRGGNIKRSDLNLTAGAYCAINGSVAVSMSSGTGNTSSATPVQRFRYTTPTSLPAGTYRLRANCKLYASAGRTAYAQVQIDDTTTELGWESSSTSTFNSRSGFHPITLTAGAHNIDTDFWVDNAAGVAYIVDAEITLEEYGGME